MDGSHLYWANPGNGTSMEANLLGTGVTTLASGEDVPEAVAMDGSHLYWSNYLVGTIREAKRPGAPISRARAVLTLRLCSCGYLEEQRSAITATACRPLSPNAAEQAFSRLVPVFRARIGRKARRR